MTNKINSANNFQNRVVHNLIILDESGSCEPEQFQAVCYDEHTGCAGCFLMPLLLLLIVFFRSTHTFAKVQSSIAQNQKIFTGNFSFSLN